MLVRKLFLAILVLVLIGAGIYGINAWYQNSHYVTTDNAEISAPLIQVTSLSSGQLTALNVEVGDWVDAGQSLAQLGTAQYSDSGNKQGFSGTMPWVTAPIKAPVSGYVAAVWTYPGAVINVGTPVITLYGDSGVWVNANIDENKINRVHPGQSAEITVDSLGGSVLKGTVGGIVPVTAATFSLLPQQNSDSNFIKVAQVITVKIYIDNPDGILLIPGSSVEAKISTR